MPGGQAMTKASTAARSSGVCQGGTGYPRFSWYRRLTLVFIASSRACAGATSSRKVCIADVLLWSRSPIRPNGRPLAREGYRAPCHQSIAEKSGVLVATSALDATGAQRRPSDLFGAAAPPGPYLPDTGHVCGQRRAGCATGSPSRKGAALPSRGRRVPAVSRSPMRTDGPRCARCRCLIMETVGGMPDVARWRGGGSAENRHSCGLDAPQPPRNASTPKWGPSDSAQLRRPCTSPSRVGETSGRKLASATPMSRALSGTRWRRHGHLGHLGLKHRERVTICPSLRMSPSLRGLTSPRVPRWPPEPRWP